MLGEPSDNYEHTKTRSYNKTKAVSKDRTSPSNGWFQVNCKPV